MENIKEADMLVREIKPEYNFLDKLYAKNPLIGNALISINSMEKIYVQAKQVLDKIVGNPSLTSSVPTNLHLLITLATINFAKKWNIVEESRFTRYVTLQFGYRDDSGKVWGIISNSLEKALSAEKRFFIKDKIGREFYETVLVHSFAPENAWDSVFDLLYDFLKHNLRWNYIKGDPIVEKMIYILNARMNGNSTDDEELVISSKEYKIKLGAKRLIQNRPEYTTELFDFILYRINDLIHNQEKEPKIFVEQLVDIWFARKISKILEGDKHQISRVSHEGNDTALSYARIKVSVVLKEGRLYLHSPAIRLTETGHKFSEIQIYENEKLIRRTSLEIFGNELGETINSSDIPVNITSNRSCNINVKIYCDDEILYDSKQSLFRRFFAFKNVKECSISSLKIGEYELYIPDPEQYILHNIEIVTKTEKYMVVNLLENFCIKLGDRILAMDASNIQEAKLVEPVYIFNAWYEIDGARYPVVESSDSYKIYADRERQGKSIQMFLDEHRVDIEQFWTDDVCDIPVRKSCESGKVHNISIINFENNNIMYQKSFLVTNKLQINFSREAYISRNDYEGARLEVILDSNRENYSIDTTDSEISIDYQEGEIKIIIPTIKYEWKAIPNIYFGNNIWKEDLCEESSVIINSSAPLDVFVEIGELTYSEIEIDLYNIVKTEEKKELYNYPIKLLYGNESYIIGQLIFSEMFTKMPIFSVEDSTVHWNGGINYIGNKTDKLYLELFDNNEKVHQFCLTLGENTFEIPNDFKDGEYTYFIVKFEDEKEHIIAQDTQFFGNPNKFRFENKTIQISEVTEDVEDGSRPKQIKPVFIENIRYISRDYVPSEDGIFDIYEGQMFFFRIDGSKKQYSSKYYDYKNNTFYKVNPVRIIYINDRFLRIVNEDDEGLYCYDNFGTKPRLELTDREPQKGDKNYKDILFYVYVINNISEKRSFSQSVIPQVLSREAHLFDKFEKVDQNFVIEASASHRMLINAGPGTGKTWTLIEKIINLVDVQAVDPETIIVLCFSTAAVEVIKGRLSKASAEERVSEIVNLVDIRTFDSFASQLLYWVKNESEYGILQYYEIGKMNYDERIDLFSSVVKDFPEIISQCEHLFVDEVQDLVKNRARMVLNMIRAIPNSSGVALFGDYCQSIYDYQTGSDNMTSSQFYSVMIDRMPGFSYFSFGRNYRQGDVLARLGDSYRNFILTGNANNCDFHWKSVVKRNVGKFKTYDAIKIALEDFQLLFEKGTVGILTRTNGQALKISAALREKGIEHVLKKRLSDDSINKWVALIFNEYSLSSMSEEDFITFYKKVKSYESKVEATEIWNALKETTKSSCERIGVRDLLRGLMTSAKNPLLYSEEKESKLTVTNIHRGKGREFDTVLVENDIFAEGAKPLDEHKVCYVALTRPREEIYRIDAKAEYMRIDKDGNRRSYKSDFVGFNKQRLTYFEIGISSDLDLRSFVRLDNVQEFLRSNQKVLIGKDVHLIKEKKKSSFVKYKIVLRSNGLILGYTSQDFFESLSRALRAIYNLPQRKALYFNVYPECFTDIYIENLVSVIESADGSEIGVKNYGDIVTWNAINIVGYGKVEY